MQAILIGATAGFILNLFYRTLAVAWPQTYFGQSGSLEPKIASHPLRYLAFRIAPPLIFAATAVVTTGRVGQTSGWLTVGSLGVVHGFRNVRAILSAVKQREIHRWLFQLFVLILIIVGIVSGYFSAHLLDPLVPAPKEFVSAIWTGAAAAFAGAYIAKVLAGGLDVAEIQRNSYAALDLPLVRYAVVESRKLGAEPWILLGIMLFENSQRPPWFRNIERLISRLSRGRVSLTQGLTQITSRSPLSDKESIDEALRRFGHRWIRPPALQQEDEYGWRESVANAHNSDHTDDIIMPSIWRKKRLGSLYFSLNAGPRFGEGNEASATNA